jgi:hypothetical protein
MGRGLAARLNVAVARNELSAKIKIATADIKRVDLIKRFDAEFTLHKDCWGSASFSRSN